MHVSRQDRAVQRGHESKLQVANGRVLALGCTLAFCWLQRYAMKAPSEQKVVVIGASIGGLASANVFFRLGYNVTVYERSEHAFRDRGSSLGFVDVPMWQRLTGRPMMRRGRPASRSQGAFFYGDLWQFLYESLPQGTVRHGNSIRSLGKDASRPRIEGQACDLVVVADGGWSGLRRCVTGGEPSYAGYVIYRGNIPCSEVPWYLPST